MSPHADGLAGQYRAAEVAGGVKLWSGSSAGGAGRGTSDRMRLHRAGCWGWTKPDSRVKLRGAIFGIQQRALLSCIGMYGCSVAARHAILASRIQCRRDGERGAIYATRLESKRLPWRRRTCLSGEPCWISYPRCRGTRHEACSRTYLVSPRRDRCYPHPQSCGTAGCVG